MVINGWYFPTLYAEYSWKDPQEDWADTVALILNNLDSRHAFPSGRKPSMIPSWSTWQDAIQERLDWVEQNMLSW